MLPIFAAASLLIHAGIIGALIIDFRSSQAKRRPATSIQVEVVRDPFAPLFRHPMQPPASERALPSPKASDGSLVLPQSAESLRVSNHAESRGVLVAAVEPRRSDDLRAAPLGASAAVPTRTGDSNATIRPLSDAPLLHPPPVLASSPADDPAVVVAMVEPRRSDDLKTAPLGRGAAVLPRTGDADIVPPTAASVPPTPAAVLGLVALPTQSSRTMDTKVSSVPSDTATVVVAARRAAATQDKAITAPGEWDGAELAPDTAAAAPSGEIATDAPTLPFDQTGKRAFAVYATVAAAPAISDEKAAETPVSIGVKIDEGEAPEKLVVDNAANVFPAALVTKRTAEIPGAVEIRMVRPSIAAVAATKVDESQAAPVTGGSLAIGMLDAAWAPWGVQVAGSFSLDRALASFAAIQQEYPVVKTEPPLVVRKVNRSRGWAPLYQILIPAPDQTAANDICRRLESADSACMVFRN